MEMSGEKSEKRAHYRYCVLQKELKLANYTYHMLKTAHISDYSWDMKYAEYCDILAQYPHFTQGRTTRQTLWYGANSGYDDDDGEAHAHL